MPTELANAGRESRICDVYSWTAPFRVWMSAPPQEWRVYHQKAHLPSVLEVWAGI